MVVISNEIRHFRLKKIKIFFAFHSFICTFAAQKNLLQ